MIKFESYPMFNIEWLIGESLSGYNAQWWIYKELERDDIVARITYEGDAGTELLPKWITAA